MHRRGSARGSATVPPGLTGTTCAQKHAWPSTQSPPRRKKLPLMRAAFLRKWRRNVGDVVNRFRSRSGSVKALASGRFPASAAAHARASPRPVESSPPGSGVGGRRATPPSSTWAISSSGTCACRKERTSNCSHQQSRIRRKGLPPSLLAERNLTSWPRRRHRGKISWSCLVKKRHLLLGVTIFSALP